MCLELKLVNFSSEISSVKLTAVINVVNEFSDSSNSKKRFRQLFGGSEKVSPQILATETGWIDGIMCCGLASYSFGIKVVDFYQLLFPPYPATTGEVN